jgi:hypothetical protein
MTDERSTGVPSHVWSIEEIVSLLGMKRSIAAYGVTFAAGGAVVAIALLAYDYVLLISPSGVNTAGHFVRLVLVVLCPPSLALMALERVYGIRLLLSLFLIVLLNAGLYGIGGVLVGCLVWGCNRLVGEGGAASN